MSEILICLEDLANNALVGELLECRKHLRGHKTIKRDILSSEMVIALCYNLVESTDLTAVRDLSMITLGYAGLLKFGEISSIKCNEILFCAENVRIEAAKRKRDQYRSVNEVLTSRGCSSAFPNSMLLRYSSLAGLIIESYGFLYILYLRSVPLVS